MKSIDAYLTFNGNCREAMTFYQKCLGGTLRFQTIGESPLSEKLPRKMKACILHATLSNGSLLLTGTDIVLEDGLIKGNAVALVLHCHAEKEIRACYKKLSVKGTPTQPLKKTIHGGLFGGLTDKYGNNWLLSCAE